MMCQQRVFRIRLAALCVACVVAVSASALEWRDATPSMRWAYELHATERGVQIDLHDQEVKKSEGQYGTVIEPEGPVAWPVFGEPRLPLIVLLFRVPADTVYEAKWSVSSLAEVSVPLLAPVLTPVAESVDNETSRIVMKPLHNEAVYTRDAYWPELLVHQEEARSADIRYLRVAISPFQYNAVTGLLRMHRGLKVTLSRVEPAELNLREDSRDRVQPSNSEYNPIWRAERSDAGSEK